MARTNSKESAGSYSQVQAEGTAALFGSSSLEQPQPTVKLHLSFLWVAVKPGGTKATAPPLSVRGDRRLESTRDLPEVAWDLRSMGRISWLPVLHCTSKASGEQVFIHSCNQK